MSATPCAALSAVERPTTIASPKPPTPPYPLRSRTAYTCRVKACAGCGAASAVVRAGLRKQPETSGDGLETVGVALEMSGKMRTSGNALPHIRFGRAPARPDVIVVVVVVGDKISKTGILSTPGAGYAPSGPNPARLPGQNGDRTRGKGIPITIPAHMRHSSARQEVTA